MSCFKVKIQYWKKKTESKKIELKDEDHIILNNLSFSYENEGKNVVEENKY